jgi:MFS transporter, SP family, inositol transporter
VSTSFPRTQPRTPNPWWVATVAGMASYIDSAVIAGSGTALVLYQESIGLSGNEIGVLSAALTFSIAVGALAGGRLGDIFGRRSVFIITMAAIVVGSASLAFSDSFTWLVLGSILVGLGSGADLPVSLATISEAANDQNRGKLIGLSQILWLGGIGASVLLGVIVGEMGRLGGQIIFGHVSVVALIVLLLRLTIPESSTWTIADQEKRAGAHTVRAERSGLKDVFSQRIYLVPFLALIAFYSLTNLAANTTGQFGAYIAVNVVGVSVQLFSIIGLLSIPVGVVFSLWFMRIADTKYRMHYVLIGGIAFVVAYGIPAVFGFSLTTLILNIVLELVGIAFAFEAIMKIWTQESFPTLLRSSTQGAVLAAARVLAASLAIVTPAFLTTPHLMYGLLSGVAGIGVAIALITFRKARFNAFEMEGQDLTEVQEKLRAEGILKG